MVGRTDVRRVIYRIQCAESAAPDFITVVNNPRPESVTYQTAARFRRWLTQAASAQPSTSRCPTPPWWIPRPAQQRCSQRWSQSPPEECTTRHDCGQNESCYSQFSLKPRQQLPTTAADATLKQLHHRSPFSGKQHTQTRTSDVVGRSGDSVAVKKHSSPVPASSTTRRRSPVVHTAAGLAKKPRSLL